MHALRRGLSGGAGADPAADGPRDKRRRGGPVAGEVRADAGDAGAGVGGHGGGVGAARLVLPRRHGVPGAAGAAPALPRDAAAGHGLLRRLPHRSPPPRPARPARPARAVPERGCWVSCRRRTVGEGGGGGRDRGDGAGGDFGGGAGGRGPDEPAGVGHADHDRRHRAQRQRRPPLPRPGPTPRPRPRP